MLIPCWRAKFTLREPPSLALPLMRNSKQVCVLRDHDAMQLDDTLEQYFVDRSSVPGRYRRESPASFLSAETMHCTVRQAGSVPSRGDHQVNIESAFCGLLTVCAGLFRLLRFVIEPPRRDVEANTSWRREPGGSQKDSCPAAEHCSRSAYAQESEYPREDSNL